jgi:hypothetical protein
MWGLRSRLRSLAPAPFGTVHLVWAVVVLAGCVVLISLGGGHPPPMIFVPPLLAAGILGHLLLLGVAWLLGKGRARAAGASGRWPLELVLIAIVLGVLSIFSIAMAIGEIAKFSTAPAIWWLFATVAVGHGTAVVLLLLHIDAARYLIAAIASGWGLALALQFREARGPDEWALGIVLVAVLAAIALCALRSRRIRSVLR